MSSIHPRVPNIDWNIKFDRHWNGGHVINTHFLNALSFLLPQGEKFFVDVTRVVVKRNNITDDALLQAIKPFTAQELIHAQQHLRYNAILNSYGYKNVNHGYLELLITCLHQFSSPLTRLASVCAIEHFTAILSLHTLKHPEIYANADQEIAFFWHWHAIEEIEHKAVSFDLFEAAGGNWLRRVLMFVPTSINLLFMFLRQYLSLLRHDGCLAPTRIFGT